MQRAATNQSSPDSTPPSSSGRPSKRARLSNGTALPITPSAHQNAIKSALEAEEQKRLLALEKHAAENGETRWVLEVQEAKLPAARPNVVSAGFGEIDALDGAYDEQDDSMAEDHISSNGRRTFGNFKGIDADASATDNDSDDSSDDKDDTDNNPTAQMIREARKKAEVDSYAQQRASQADRKRKAFEDPPGEVDLKRLKSVSGGRPSGGGSARASRPQQRCFKCNKPGHRKADCPN
jgi:hypothetical protein